LAICEYVMHTVEATKARKWPDRNSLSSN
jgi:hypothetical protein